MRTQYIVTNHPCEEFAPITSKQANEKPFDDTIVFEQNRSFH
ncbi:hypothetical protein OCAR_5836 [Afipia carboxidovorans OM5]|nr:hypothetical protein OCAR_5836 [Afipia carboxidovorans OM5]